MDTTIRHPIMIPTIAGHLQYAFDMQLSHEEKVAGTLARSRCMCSEGMIANVCSTGCFASGISIVSRGCLVHSLNPRKLGRSAGGWSRVGGVDAKNACRCARRLVVLSLPIETATDLRCPRDKKDALKKKQEEKAASRDKIACRGMAWKRCFASKPETRLPRSKTRAQATIAGGGDARNGRSPRAGVPSNSSAPTPCNNMALQPCCGQIHFVSMSMVATRKGPHAP